MKKLLIFTCALLLILACQKGANDLVVDGDLSGVGAGNLPTITALNPAAYGEITDQYSVPAGIQGKIEVTFSDYMNAGSVTNLANITLLNTTTGTAVPDADITTEYFPELRKLYIYIDPVPADGKYLLRLVSAGGMVNTYGKPLDFDGDNNEDGNYDDYLIPYWTQAANADTFVFPIQPTIATFSPDTIATINQQPFITITFTGGAMDTLTLNTSNITLANQSGAAQTLNLIDRDASSVVLQPASALPTAANYTITVKCDNIKRLGDHATPAEFLKLDGNDDGPAASEPDLQSIFRVDDPTLPPHLSGVAAIGTSGALFTFSRLIDETTITKATIAVYDNGGYVPGDFRIYTDAGNNYTMVEYYFLRATVAGRHGWVSKDLQAQNGYFFDGDNNGIGGEPWDNQDVAF
jgi:hypothetical protein